MNTYELSQDEFRTIELAGHNAGCEVLPDYSGRFMYGAMCLAVAYASAMEFAQFIMELQEKLDPEFIEQIKQAERYDDLGLSTLIYWPHITVKKGVSA